MEKINSEILDEVFRRISPELKVFIRASVLELEVKAKATHNPWDDLAVVLLKGVLNIE